MEYKYWIIILQQIIVQLVGAQDNQGRYIENGHSQNSTYVQYVPEVQYTRAYRSMSRKYKYYYNKYFTYSMSDEYRMRTYLSKPDIGVCVNYEAVEGGSPLGVFKCPLSFEPDDFTACCGYKYAEYCCQRSKEISKSYRDNLSLIFFILVACVSVLFALFWCCRRCCKKKQVQDQPQQKLTPRNKFRTGSGAYPVNYGYNHSGSMFSSGTIKGTPRKQEDVDSGPLPPKTDPSSQDLGKQTIDKTDPRYQYVVPNSRPQTQGSDKAMDNENNNPANKQTEVDPRQTPENPEPSSKDPEKQNTDQLDPRYNYVVPNSKPQSNDQPMANEINQPANQNDPQITNQNKEQIDDKGSQNNQPISNQYGQNNQPIINQNEIDGHSVKSSSDPTSNLSDTPANQTNDQPNNPTNNSSTDIAKVVEENPPLINPENNEEQIHKTGYGSSLPDVDMSKVPPPAVYQPKKYT